MPFRRNGHAKIVPLFAPPKIGLILVAPGIRDDCLTMISKGKLIFRADVITPREDVRRDLWDVLTSRMPLPRKRCVLEGNL